jgi:hypothetical protein
MREAGFEKKLVTAVASERSDPDWLSASAFFNRSRSLSKKKVRFPKEALIKSH